MKTISVWNEKGGVGKTTISFNVATILASRGKKVLCLDFDPQANLTSFFEKDLQRKFSKKNIGQLAGCNFKGMDKSIYKSRFVNLDYIRGCNKEAELQNINALRTALEDLDKMYEFCIIDCHPDYSHTSQSALFASDLVLVPIALDAFSRDNLNLVSNHIETIEYLREEYLQDNYELDYWIFGNRVAKRKSQISVYQDLVTKHDYPMLDLCISESAVVSSANAIHKPVFAHRKNALPAHDLEELVDVIEMGVK